MGITLTPADEERVHAVIDVLEAWEFDWAEDKHKIFDVIKKISGHDLYLAVRTIPKSSPHWVTLIRVIECYIAADPTGQSGMWVRTNFGWENISTMRQEGVKVWTDDDGVQRFMWPVARKMISGPTEFNDHPTYSGYVYPDDMGSAQYLNGETRKRYRPDYRDV